MPAHPLKMRIATGKIYRLLASDLVSIESRNVNAMHNQHVVQAVSNSSTGTSGPAAPLGVRDLPLLAGAYVIRKIR